MAEKSKLSKEEKKARRRKRAKKIILSIIAVFVAFKIVTVSLTMAGIKQNRKQASEYAPVGCNLKIDNVSDGVWNIHSDKELKVLQLTDIHIGGGWLSTRKDSMAINAVAAMITAEKPDFVIATGDIAYPVFFQAGTFNNKTGAKIFAELMEQLGVYWTVGFGNHDTEAYSYFSREQIKDFYSSGDYPHCLLQAGPEDVDGVGNQVFNVVNSDGITTRSLMVFDSHSYVDGDIFGIFWKYDNIHQNQVDWYKETVNSLSAKNAEVCKADTALAAKYSDLCKKVPTSIFMHIPLTEYEDAWTEYAENGYKDTANVKYNYGYAGESNQLICCGVHTDELFETILALGSTDTVFSGHDHLNNFSLTYKGVDLIYGKSVDYLAYPGIYKLGSQRGCTVIKVAGDGTLTYEPQSYYQDKYVSAAFDKEPVTMQALDAEYKK